MTSQKVQLGNMKKCPMEKFYNITVLPHNDTAKLPQIT